MIPTDFQNSVQPSRRLFRICLQPASRTPPDLERSIRRGNVQFRDSLRKIGAIRPQIVAVQNPKSHRINSRPLGISNHFLLTQIKSDKLGHVSCRVLLFHPGGERRACIRRYEVCILHSLRLCNVRLRYEEGNRSVASLVDVVELA